MKTKGDYICVECGRPLREHDVNAVGPFEDPEYPVGYTEYWCPPSEQS